MVMADMEMKVAAARVDQCVGKYALEAIILYYYISIFIIKSLYFMLQQL